MWTYPVFVVCVWVRTCSILVLGWSEGGTHLPSHWTQIPSELQYLVDRTSIPGQQELLCPRSVTLCWDEISLPCLFLFENRTGGNWETTSGSGDIIWGETRHDPNMSGSTVVFRGLYAPNSRQPRPMFHHNRESDCWIMDVDTNQDCTAEVMKAILILVVHGWDCVVPYVYWGPY